MDGLIAGYVEDTCTIETAYEISRSFQLFSEAYNEDYEISFIELISRAENITPEDLHDLFLNDLHKKVDFIFEQHGIQLVDDINLREKNELLTALLQIQQLTDYHGVVEILESDLPDEEKLGEIFAQYCTLDVSTIINFISEYDKVLMYKLKVMVYDKDKDSDIPVVKRYPNVISKLKLLREFSVGKELFGIKLVEGGFNVNLPFKVYFPFIEDSFKGLDNLEEIVLHIYSLLLISEKGLEQPLLLFREHSYLFSDDANIVTKLDVLLTQLINNVDKFSITKNNTETLNADQFKPVNARG